MFVWINRGILSIAVLGLLAAAPAQAQNGLSVAGGAAAVLGACPDPATDPVDVATPCLAIVSFDPAVSRDERSVIVRGTGAAVRFNFTIVDAAAVLVPNEGAYWALAGEPDVTALTPDRRVEAFGKPAKCEPWPSCKDGGGDPVDGGGSDDIIPAGVSRIGAPDLWPDPDGVTGSGVTAWIVDTGLDSGHPDLTNYAGDGVTCLGDAGNAVCDLGGEDDNGHGTHVGGIVGAVDNGADVVGVAPGVTLKSVKVLDSSGSGYDSNVIAGLDYVRNNATGLDVVNMSLGRPGRVDDNGLLRTAVQNLVSADITVVVAAGNDPFSEISDMVPASYPEVMAVASTTAQDGGNNCRRYKGYIAADTASYFTTDGADDPNDPDDDNDMDVTISAPGEDKEDINGGCRAQSVGILSLAMGGGTTRKSGTSMASPHVAGVVALMLDAANAALTPNYVRCVVAGNAALAGTTPIDSPTNGYSYDGVKEGIVDAVGAVGGVGVACP